jgi:hypothetical protein
LHRIPLWTLGPIFLTCAALGGTTNPDDSVQFLVIAGVICSVVFTLPWAWRVYRDYFR